MVSLIVSAAVLLVAPVFPPGPALTAPAAPTERTLQHSGILKASLDDAWSIFTTEQGWTGTVGVAKAEVDFKLGGTIRTVYDPKATIGDDSTITNTIIAYEPKRMIAFKPGAPKGAPEHIKKICETGWNVIRFEPLTPDRTRLTITGMGFKEGELYDKAYDFFDKGNAWTLKKIQDHFESPAQAKAVEDAEKLIFRMTGKWAFTKERPDGGKFSGETDGKLLFDGKLLVADGFLTIGEKTFQHSHFLATRDPETKTLRAWSINQDGDVTDGEVRLDGPEKLIVDWDTHQRSDDRFVAYRVEYTFKGADEFKCVVMGPPAKDGKRATLVDVDYKRVKTEGNAAK